MKTLVIGISGGSGSGKTTLARMLEAGIGRESCLWLSQDRYYRSHPPELKSKVNYDHPDALEFELLAEHLEALRAGEPVRVPQYDFATHARHPDWVELPWRPVVIVDGILILSQPQIRDLFDYRLFVDTHEDIRFQRRLVRDVRERGRTPEGVREQFLGQVKPMHDLFVEPSRRFADRIVSGTQNFRPVVEDILFGLKDRHTLDRTLIANPV